MKLFAEIEKSIERGFRKWTERVLGPAESNELLLVHRAILEEIEGRVETLAGGRRVFPYARVIVTLVAADAERRTRWQAALGEGGRLASGIREALQRTGCETPRGMAVEVRSAEAGGEGAPSGVPSGPAAPFTIEYLVEAPPAAVEPAPQPQPGPGGTPEATPVAGPARLVVVKGKAEPSEYTLERARTNLGRMAELTDSEQRVVRRNDIVFEEGGDEVNGTVSRRHAHIRREADGYRLCDDESEFGTRVFRNGRPIEVPAGNRRGEKLRPGDEIYLGRACLRFEQ
ncbi:MAG: FHA domain-containing protein [Bryobacteraceae bacterium]